MKTSFIIILGITLIFSSCKDSKTESVSEKNMNSEKTLEIDQNPDTYSDPDGIYEDTDSSNSINNSQTSKPDTNTVKTKPEIGRSNLSGTYIKIGEEIDNSCACYCLNINYTGNTEMCLTPAKVFINTRLVKESNQLTNIFLVAPSSKNTEGKDIPWDKFDKNIPIATLKTTPDGKIEMDWLGFTINGDLALDYAILGKKTLEGNYKKK